MRREEDQGGFSCGKGPVPSARSKRGMKKVRIEAGGLASVVEESRACFVLGYENVLRFRNVGRLAGDNLMQVARDYVSVTEGKAEKIIVRKELEKGANSELGELRFGVGRAVSRGLTGVVAA